MLDHQTQTVLHFVASKNYVDTARLLVAHPTTPASARVRDKRGQYALHRAAAIGSVPMLNLLVAQKSPLNATDADGQTALHHAVAEGHGDAAFALLKAGADLAKEDAQGKTPLDLAPDKEVRFSMLRRNGCSVVACRLPKRLYRSGNTSSAWPRTRGLSYDRQGNEPFVRGEQADNSK